ncbi:MAG: hypothetical protein Q9198_009052, partial [Flavoplaca austrocitrina]
NRKLQIECDATNCNNSSCGNREMTEATPEFAVVEVYQCDLGKGLRAKQDFEKGAFITEYKGDIVDGRELKCRMTCYEQDEVSILPDPTS